MKDYHDYVIKNGKFVGKFEEMYQSCEDPWNQSDQSSIINSASRNATNIFIRKFNIHSIVEFGCGLGHTSNFTHNETKVDILGVDISQSAVERASKEYPKLKFKVDDVLNIGSYSGFDGFLFSEITWYLLEGKLLDRVLETMKEVHSGKYFIHCLVFYKGQQKYGLDYFSNLNEFIDFVPFELIGRNFTDLESSGTVETCSIFRI